MPTIEEWDRWFEATGDEQSIREWRAAKEVTDDPGHWAAIIEMNRLDRITKRTIPTHIFHGV